MNRFLEPWKRLPAVLAYFAVSWLIGAGLYVLAVRFLQ